MSPRRALFAVSCVLWAGACSVAIALPDRGTEEDPATCVDGSDNDLDGEMDCADRGCRDYCAGGVRTPPSVDGCFRDDALDLAYLRAAVGPTDDPRERCDPDRVSPPPACGAGERLLPGASACLAPGRACGSETWSPHAGHAEHVQPGARDGDGSEARPWGTLEEALAALEASARPVEERVILLAEGEHAAPSALPSDVEIRGVCAARTRLRGPVRVEVDAGAVVFADLSLAAEGVPLAVRGSATVRGTIVEGAIEVEGEAGALALEDAWVRADGELALAIDGGARATLIATAIEAPAHGVRVGLGELSLRGVAIRGTTEIALSLGPGARAFEVAGVLVEPTAGLGVEVACTSGPERCAVLDDLVVRGPGTLTRLEGVRVRDGRVRLRRASISRTRGPGLALEGAVLELEDSWVTSTENAPSATDGVGVLVGAGAELQARRVFVWDYAHRGVEIDDGGAATLADVEIVGNAHSALALVCLEARRGSELHAVAFTLANCGVCGLRLEADVAPLMLTEGAIVRSSRGTCLSPTADYPLDVLSTFVLYRDNELGNFYREDR